MATTRSFQAMLNEYLPNRLLKEDLVKRDWILNNVEKDDSWKGGTLIVPFKGIQASSVSFGSLTTAADIGEDGYVRGEISTQPEVWGSMTFNHRDIMEHDRLSEQNLLKLLPDAVDDFSDYMKQCVSLNFLSGAAFAKFTADGAADGTFTTDRPERFVLKQKVYVDDDDSAVAAAGYVQSINMDTGVISLDTTRAGGADLNIAAYTVAQNAKVYFDGTQPGVALGFTSLRDSLLSAANGGSTDLYGETKTDYPYLQAINVDGSGVDSSNILQKIFDAYVTIKNRGKGEPNQILMSYRNLGYVMTVLESTKGLYHVDPKSTKVSPYGWTEIEIFGVKGKLKVVGVQEMDDDVMFFLDLRALKIYSNGQFRKRVAPDGKEYFESRATTGYSYIVDICFFGDLVLLRPSYCGIMYDIP
jgi:hypothetical protein